MSSFKYMGRLSQPQIYEQLRTQGSSWLKSHVLFADRQLIVLNKPPDLICQLDNSDDPLNSGLSLNPVFKDIRACYPTAHPCTVHRLDKMTTGCFVIPVQHSAAKSLSLQFQHGTVNKSYLALVRGGEKSFSETSGRIEAPLLYRDGRPEIHPTGKRSITEWELLASSPKVPISLLKLNLITGNKHQLRVHLARALKAPILGDILYSRTLLQESITSRAPIPDNRLFLHGSDLSFFKYRPNGKRFRLGIRAPVPVDFRQICKKLDIALPSSYTKASIFVDDQLVDDSVINDSITGASGWELARALESTTAHN